MSSFCTAHFFSKKFQHICVSLDVNFNELLTNDVVSFEQLGPGGVLHLFENNFSNILTMGDNINLCQMKDHTVIFKACKMPQNHTLRPL